MSETHNDSLSGSSVCSSSCGQAKVCSSNGKPHMKTHPTPPKFASFARNLSAFMMRLASCCCASNTCASCLALEEQIANLTVANFAPSKRLVGIELNPGPTVNVKVNTKMKKKKNSSRGTQNNSSSSSSAPVAVTKSFANPGPRFVRSDARSVVISHRELCYNVTGTASPLIALRPINPGIISMFPWLSTQALGFEKYRFRKLKFSYHTRCSTSAAGSVALAIDYDASDQIPTSESQMLTYSRAVEYAPWTNFDYVCDPKSLDRVLFTRGGTANGDIRLYDIGNLLLLTTDGSTTPWGKLFVEYEIELSIPQSNPLVTTNATFTANNTGTQTSSLLFGNVQFDQTSLPTDLPAGVGMVTNSLVPFVYHASGSVTIGPCPPKCEVYVSFTIYSPTAETATCSTSGSSNCTPVIFTYAAPVNNPYMNAYCHSSNGLPFTFTLVPALIGANAPGWSSCNITTISDPSPLTITL